MLLFLAAAAAAAPNTVPAIVGGLQGCWRVAGQVRGRDATSVARGEWHLGRRYFILHLRSISPAQPYEAAISYGAGEKPGSVGSFWMDTFGGLYEPSLGLGAVASEGFSLDYRFPDTVYHNRFERSGKRWRWTIVEQSAGQPDKPFAKYTLRPASCHGITFGF
jgi:hypothetical protein